MTKQEYIQNAKNIIDDIENRLSELYHRRGFVPEDLRPEFESILDQLNIRYGEIKEEADRLQYVAPKLWEQTTDAFSAQLDQLKQEIKNLNSYISRD